MAKIPSSFTKYESPFKVLEDMDLNYQTPTSSTRVQKKLQFNNASSEKRENKVTFWRERFVFNKHPLQITTLGLKTPPMDQSPSIQPLAPIKSRKSITKMDLKPKKLIFRDIEESELVIVKNPSKFAIKHDDNVINERQYKSKINREKQTASDEKENQRDLLFLQIKNTELNNDKVDSLNTRGSTSNYRSSSVSINSSSALSLIQSKNSHINGGLKHFRI